VSIDVRGEGRNMNRYLLIFSITPVQGFISQARKTKDLFAGSSILSELAKKGIKKGLELKGKLIMPKIENLEEAESIPNRFVMEFENCDIEMGKQIEKAVLDHWYVLAQDTLNYIKEEYRPNIDNYQAFKEKFLDHIENFFQIYWVCYPLDEGYRISYKNAECYMGAIKNVKIFSQFATEEDNRKCVLCGERDAIFYKKQEKQPAYAYINSLKIDTHDLEQNEGLCGVCFVKRFYKEGEKFPSTSDIALWDVVELLGKDEKGKVLLEDFKKVFSDKQKPFNSQLLYEENLTIKYFKDYGYSEELLPKAKRQHNLIVKFLEDKGYKLKKYYATIKFDGDYMGKWLSGEHLKKGNLKDFHEGISSSLRQFAKEARSIVDKQRGRTVYAGGDDFLGFIHVKELFEVLKRLRETFKLMVNDKLGSSFSLKSRELTFSAGVVIAHYKLPLSLVLKWADKAEREAKSVHGKDAVCIVLLRRAGEIDKLLIKWEFFESLLKVFDIFVEQRCISSSLVQKLLKSLQKLPMDIAQEEIMKEELKRQIKRSMLHNNGCLQEEALKDFEELLTGTYYTTKSFDNFLSALKILRFLREELGYADNH